MTDIEIAKNTKLDEINKIAEKLEIKEEDIEQYGKYKAKISNEIYEKNKTNTYLFNIKWVRGINVYSVK